MSRYFNYNRDKLQHPMLKNLEDNFSSVEEAKSKTAISIGYPGWNLLYYCLFTSLKSNDENIIVETGTNWGLSTIVLAQALIDSGYKGHVHSIDINPEFIEKAKQNISKTNLSNYISLYCKDSALYLET